MSYFDRLAAFATGQFSRAEVQIREFIPLYDEVSPETSEPHPGTQSSTPSPARPSVQRESSPVVSEHFTREQSHHETTHHEATRTEIHRESSPTLSQTEHFHRQEIREGDRALTIRQEHNQLLVAIRNEFKAGLACQHHETVILAGSSGLETRPFASPTAPRRPVSALAPKTFSKGTRPDATTTSTETSAKSEPEIHVHIGRIDVKAPSTPARTEPVREKPKGVISLEEYLAQRRAN